MKDCRNSMLCCKINDRCKLLANVIDNEWIYEFGLGNITNIVQRKWKAFYFVFSLQTYFYLQIPNKNSYSIKKSIHQLKKSKKKLKKSNQFE